MRQAELVQRGVLLRAVLDLLHRVLDRSLRGHDELGPGLGEQQVLQVGVVRLQEAEEPLEGRIPVDLRHAAPPAMASASFAAHTTSTADAHSRRVSVPFAERSRTSSVLTMRASRPDRST